MEDSVENTESGKCDVSVAEQDGNDDTADSLPASKRAKREKSKDKSKPASPKRKKSVEKKDSKDQSKTPDNDTNDENENVKNETVKNKTKKEDSIKNGTGTASGIPLITDPRLPVGWMRKVVQRQGGQSAGKFDVYIYSPEGKKFRSRSELQRHFDKTSSSLKIEDFDFTVHGSGSKTAEKPTKRKLEVKSKKSKSEPAPKKTKSEPAVKKTKSKGKKASSSKQRLVVKLNFSPKKRALESLKESDTSEAETDTKSSKRKKAAAASKTKTTSPAKAEAKSSPKSKTRRRR